MPDVSRRVQEAIGDRYVVERELGRGGMAVVYLATDVRQGRKVAVKVLQPQLAAGIGPSRFLREIEIAGRLTHPHILPLFDSGHAGDLLYYVMPYIAGESLRERLHREIQLPVSAVVQIGCDIASALEAAHQHGIMHRDIKPENILLDGDQAMVADFGIARAVHVAAGSTISEPGIAVGTPAYMSPEQGSAQREVDARSDIYSLGCVLYEMLAGEPPFTGATAQAVLARHLTEAPRAIANIRPGVPAELEAVIATALAKVPADRYRTAGELLHALQMVSSPTGAVRAAPRQQAWLRRLTPRWLLLLVAISAAALGALVQPWSRGPRLDASLMLVAPFSHRDGAVPHALSGDLCESLLHRAMTRWDGLRVVDPLWVADARARRGYETVHLAEALQLARDRGAGRLATGEVFAHGDTLFVFAALYDVADDGELLRQATAAVAQDLHDASAQFERLARLLVAGDPAAGSADTSTAAGTRSLPAWRAFQAGMLALRDFDLDSAQASFRAAIAADDRYPQPRLWLAHAEWLADAEGSDWPRQVREADLLGERLGPGDRERARALRALAEQRFADACRHYADLVARDSLDFLAWFGLGECQHRDRAVVTDPASPSGWSFRSSAHRAVEAYRRALDALPSSHAVFRGRAHTRLAELFLTDASYFRLGHRAAADTAWFGAWPGVDGDTLSLVPYPLEQLLDGEPATRPSTRQRALRQGRVVVRDLAERWAVAFPRNADAREAFARALEALGVLAGTAPSALGELRAARSFATSTPQQMRLAVGETRVLVKLYRFDEASRSADSILERWTDPDPASAAELAGLAMLRGRTDRAAALMRQAAPSLRFISYDGTPVEPGNQLAAEVGALLAYAAAGSPLDSIRRIRQRVERGIAMAYSADERSDASDALLARSDALAFFAGLPEAVPGDSADGYLLQLQRAVATGRGSEAAAVLRAEQAGRDGPPGDVTIDGVLSEARIFLAAGDTAAAAARLDMALGALPTFGSDLVGDVPQAAALVQTLELRSELARAGNDRYTLARWSAAAAALRDDETRVQGR